MIFTLVISTLFSLGWIIVGVFSMYIIFGCVNRQLKFLWEDGELYLTVFLGLIGGYFCIFPCICFLIAFFIVKMCNSHTSDNILTKFLNRNKL